jgi:hypothetical protein
MGLSTGRLRPSLTFFEVAFFGRRHRMSPRPVGPLLIAQVEPSRRRGEAWVAPNTTPRPCRGRSGINPTGTGRAHGPHSSKECHFKTHASGYDFDSNHISRPRKPAAEDFARLCDARASIRRAHRRPCRETCESLTYPGVAPEQRAADKRHRTSNQKSSAAAGRLWHEHRARTTRFFPTAGNG